MIRKKLKVGKIIKVGKNSSRTHILDCHLQPLNLKGVLMAQRPCPALPSEGLTERGPSSSTGPELRGRE